jgi:hypothetical protein
MINQLSVTSRTYENERKRFALGMSKYQDSRELVLKALMSIDVLVVLVLTVLKYC